MAGLGVLFIGMDMMSAAMVPLRDSQAFISLMTRFSNPLLGILAGAVFTAIIQSSSASVGILQTLAASGLIGLPSAVYVLFGQNIGTCITAVLASIGTSRNAKRTTVIHLMFNLFGTALFTLLCQTTPLTGFLQSLAPASPSAQIALTHTMFNIVTTMVLLFWCLSGDAHCQYHPSAHLGAEAQVVECGPRRVRSGAGGVEYCQDREDAERSA